MKIHGIRIYPQTVSTLPGRGARIFVHGRLAKDRSDLDYIFRPLASAWRDHVFVWDFAVCYTEDGRLKDPIPTLRARYGPHLHDADVKTQLLMVRAEGFSSWAPTFHSDEGATLAVFREPPSYSLVQRMFWDPDSRLCSESWPAGMRSLLHNWDDVFWQLFTVEPADIDLLTRSHSADPTLKMYFVDLDREFPDPSHEELVPVV